MPTGRISHNSGDSGPVQIAAGRKGIARSVAFAEGRFTNLAEEYWRLWLGAEYEIFTSWLHVLKRTVADEVASIWKGHTDPIDRWYESECRRVVEKAQGDLVRKWAERAQRVELAQLKHDEQSEDAIAVSWKSPELGAEEGARCANETAQPILQPQAPISDAKEKRSDAFGGGHRTISPVEDVDTAQPALSFQGIAKGPCLNRPSRNEIDKFANQAFAVERNRILKEYAEKQKHVLDQVRRTGNSGGYLPAITKWGTQRLRETILAEANSYAEAFTASGVPSDAKAEAALKRSSLEFAIGTVSNIRGQLDLMSKRTRRPMSDGTGYIEREIEKSRVSALAEGNLKLERQRIAVAAAAETVAPTAALGGNPSRGVTEGAMADTDFWRRAETQFRRLQPRPPQPGEAAHDSHNGLYAHWNPNGWTNGDPWYLSNGENAIKKLFSWAAESAAVELGHLGGASALFFWLDLLRRDSPFYKQWSDGGYIYRLCDASAEYCLKCETNAKAAARQAALGSRNELSEDQPAVGKDGNPAFPEQVAPAEASPAPRAGPPPGSKGTTGRARDITLLRRADGTQYDSVDFPTAEKYADISPRRRQQLMKHGPLLVVGKGQKRRITVESLIAYCPPAEYAK
jgi:hypothetical protein